MITRKAMYDTNLKFVEDKNGTAIYEYKLHPYGLYSEIKRFNSEGKLAQNNEGVSTTRYSPSINGLYYLEEPTTASGDFTKNAIVE